MGHKKYYGYKKPTEHYSVTFQDDTEGRVKKVGTLLKGVYSDEVFNLVKVNWGSEEEYKRSRDGEVEMSWYFDEENTKKLMLRTGTHHARDMVQALYDRFAKYRGDADSHIIKWCDQKEIVYDYYVHY